MLAGFLFFLNFPIIHLCSNINKGLLLFQHGRVKVRTSDEEKARKEKERQEKLKKFKHAMQIIRNKVNFMLLKICHYLLRTQ